MAVDFIQKSAGNSASTTLSSSVSNTDTSFPLTSDTNFLSGGGLVIVDEGQVTEELAYYTGKSGSSLTVPLVNRGLEGGSPQAHSAGATVKGVLTADTWNNITEALLNVVSVTDGALDTTKVVDLTTAQTLTTKTLTSPVLTTPQINDTSLDHQYIVTPSELSADRTVTLPLLTGNDEFVFKDFTQTLTNKRLTSPKINEDVALTSTATELNVLDGITASTAELNIMDGVTSTAAELNALDGQTGAWTAFTPTLTNITLGNGTNSGKYIKLGKLVVASYWFKFGSTTSITGSMGFSLPVTGSSVPQTPQFICTILDSGTQYLSGTVHISSTRCDLLALNSSGTYLTTVGCSSTVPMTWATNDEAFWYVVYEAA